MKKSICLLVFIVSLNASEGSVSSRLGISSVSEITTENMQSVIEENILNGDIIKALDQNIKIKALDLKMGSSSSSTEKTYTFEYINMNRIFSYKAGSESLKHISTISVSSTDDGSTNYTQIQLDPTYIDNISSSELISQDVCLNLSENDCTSGIQGNYIDNICVGGEQGFCDMFGGTISTGEYYLTGSDYYSTITKEECVSAGFISVKETGASDDSLFAPLTYRCYPTINTGYLNRKTEIGGSNYEALNFQQLASSQVSFNSFLTKCTYLREGVEYSFMQVYAHLNRKMRDDSAGNYTVRVSTTYTEAESSSLRSIKVDSISCIFD